MITQDRPWRVGWTPAPEYEDALCPLGQTRSNSRLDGGRNVSALQMLESRSRLPGDRDLGDGLPARTDGDAVGTFDL